MQLVPAAIRSQGRSDNFHLLRLIFATMVLLSHSYALAGGAEPLVSGRTMGSFAVHCFFVISGYLVTGSFLNARTPIDYVWRRALRIVPGLVIAYVLSVYLARLHGNYVGNPIPYIANGSLWTLSWESLLYAVLFIVGLIGMLSPSGMTAIYAAGLALFGAFLGNTSETFLVVVPFFLLFCGGAFIRMREGDFDIRFMGVLSLAVLLALNIPAAPQALRVAFDYFPFPYGPGIGSGMLWLFLHVLTLPFAVIMIARYCPISIRLRHDYSYGVYVFAWPAQQLTIFYLIKWAFPLHPLAVFAISGMVTFALAVLLWHLVERPAMRLKGGRPQRAGDRHWSEVPKADSA
jgi:peptidoglycan/LPS O-acetylase OafA/YrhL